MNKLLCTETLELRQEKTPRIVRQFPLPLINACYPIFSMLLSGQRMLSLSITVVSNGEGIHLVDFSIIFGKGDKCLLSCTPSPFEKRVRSQNKEFYPQEQVLSL